MNIFEFLSTEFAACSKPPSRDNHCKVSYPRTQQRDYGAGFVYCKITIKLAKALFVYGKLAIMQKYLIMEPPEK